MPPAITQLLQIPGLGPKRVHAHTRATDGHNSLREMAVAARDLGLTYLAITEHSRRLSVARGLDPERLGKQVDEIDRRGWLEARDVLNARALERLWPLLRRPPGKERGPASRARG